MTAAPVLPDEVLAQHVAILGKTGAGKTYIAKGFVERLLRLQRRVCVIDPTGVWWGLRASADGRKNGFAVVVAGGQHADLPIGENAGPAIAELIATRNLPLVIDLSDLLLGARHRFMTAFAEHLHRHNRGALHLVIDEADEFAPQNPLPETKRMLHQIDRLVRRGRVKGFRIIMISQRPAVLHKNVLTQANTLIALRLTAPQDRKALDEWIKGQADVDAGREVTASLAKLKRGEGWVWAPEHDLLQRAQFSRITTFDSSADPDDDGTVAAPATLADVDLSAVHDALNDIEVEHKANDPALLKKRIRELERELAKAQRGAPKPDPAAIDAAFQRGAESVVKALTPKVDALRREVEAALAKAPPARARPEGGNGADRRRAAAVPPRRMSGVVADSMATSKLTGPQQRIVNALAWFEAVGQDQVRRPPLAYMADYSAKSSGFDKAVGQCLGLGLVSYPAGGVVALTEEGRAQARAPDEHLTTADLHAAVLAKLPPAWRRVAQALFDIYPDAITRPDLAERTDYSRKSSGFDKAVGRLNSLGIAEYPPGRGLVRATDEMFLDG